MAGSHWFALNLIVVACILLQSIALARHPEKEREAIEKTLQHQIALIDRQDVEGWKSDLAPEATVEGLHETYTVRDLQRYFDKIGAARMRSTVTTPFSINDYHGAFVRTITGKSKDGCSFTVENVVSIVRFNEKLKVTNWQDHWQGIEAAKQCGHSDL